jgi:Methylamine utilisation protein MauE
MIHALALSLRLTLALVLAAAATAKVARFVDFRRTVRAVLGSRGARPAAAAVVAAESVLAASLGIGALAGVTALATVVLFVGFAALSVWAVWRGLRVTCNCFGRANEELGRATLARSALLAGAAATYWALLQASDLSLAAREIPPAAGLALAFVLTGRWLLAGGDLVRIIRQRRRLDFDLAAQSPPAR